MYLLNLLIIWSVTQGSATIIKDNGESMRLSAIEFYQVKDKASISNLSFMKGSRRESISLSSLKRINFKEMVKKTKGVPTWQVILVEDSNVKHEVQMDLVEIVGINAEGEKQVIQANNIDKITL